MRLNQTLKNIFQKKFSKLFSESKLARFSSKSKKIQSIERMIQSIEVLTELIIRFLI